MSDFRWLLIDSCGGTATLAVGFGERVIATEAVGGRAFSAEWPGVLRRLLAELEWGVGELQAVGVVHGPGSFTGVRVGLAAAKGLCEAVGAKLIAMSRLEVLGGEGALAVIDGGRDEFYVRDGGREWLAKRDELIGMAQERHVVTLDARVVEVVTAELVEIFAVPMLVARWRAGEFDDVATIDANYVRGERDIYARKAVGTVGA